MRQAAIGCLGILIGLIVGIVLMVGFFNLGANSNVETPLPAPNASRVDVSITASAAFLNAQLSQTIKQSGFAKQATVSLGAPNVVQVAAVIETTVLGQRVSLNTTTRMRVSVQAGRIVLTVDKVDTGNLPIPQAFLASMIENVRAQAENQINALAQRSLQGTNLRVTNVRITPNDVTVDLVGP